MGIDEVQLYSDLTEQLIHTASLTLLEKHLFHLLFGHRPPLHQGFTESYFWSACFAHRRCHYFCVAEEKFQGKIQSFSRIPDIPRSAAAWALRHTSVAENKEALA